MCCCPIRFVQCIVVTVAFLMLVVGSLTVGSSVYAKNNQFLIYAGDSDTIAIISLIFGILTTALSLLGIYGGFKRNRLCLFLFAINLIIVLVIELAISIILFQTRNSYHESYATLECPASPSERVDDRNVQNIIDAYQNAASSFCRDCRCNYKFTASGGMRVAKDGVLDFQQCPQYDEEVDETAVNLMAAVEATYFCAGLCFSPQPSSFPALFYFSNVNNNEGVSNGLCDKYLWEFVNYQTNFGGGFAAGMAGLSLLSFVVLLILCFHPNKAQYWEVPKEEDQL